MKYDICVLGGCSLDQTYFQNIDGQYDDKPNSIAPGGKGSNQAVAASRAGAKTAIISRIGDDEIGRTIIENLKFNNIDTKFVEMVKGLQNDYSNIYVNLKDKDNNIERFNGAINSFTPDMVDRYSEVLLDSKIIVCQLKAPKEVTEKLIDFCYNNNKILVLTPCRPEKLSISDSHNLDLIDKISVITCNKKECETIFGTDNIETCVSKYPNKLIVTLGSDGLIYHNGERIVRMPAIDTDVLDTTGAGDTLCGNLCAFMAQGLDMQHSLRKAMYASAMKLKVKTAQAGMPYLEDLENFISNTRNRKFKYGKELDLALELIKEAYEQVKFNGNLNVHLKKDDTIVTDADLAIEKYLVTKIKEMFPNDYFVTEENYPDNNLSNRTWIIDPIDGTAHFIKKDGMWGIQLAFYDLGTTKFSVIYLPEKNELYYACENQGVYINNNKILPMKSSPIKQSIVEFGGSIYKQLDIKKVCFNKLINDGKLAISNVLHINACCVSYTNLITAKTDALIVSTNRPWDIMPGEFMCKECGIKLYHIDFDNQIRLFTNNEELKNLIITNE